ncbi:hypothetical protein BT96DRAFT_949464 [Gymnopus androsaceus JB14]|uniref:Uncharacterized protein n=1 Tax=Gymnopus androsaceus JB14 TaxID=1447944 RepID=A0A6A4GKY7_9AGAR|nr:hypothetical protein BT96DRAFT_949464 [Gymnopus androsaceus JB14]
MTENGGLDVMLEDIEVEAEGENEEESLPLIKNSLNPESGSTPVTPNPAKSDSSTTEQPTEITENMLTSMSTCPVRARSHPATSATYALALVIPVAETLFLEESPILFTSQTKLYSWKLPSPRLKELNLGPLPKPRDRKIGLDGRK